MYLSCVSVCGSEKKKRDGKKEGKRQTTKKRL
jgi:hypothetical protein